MAAILDGGSKWTSVIQVMIDKFESFILVSLQPKGILMFLHGKPFSGMSQNS